MIKQMIKASALVLAPIALLASCDALDELLSVEEPSRVVASDLEDPNSAQLLVASVANEFRCAHTYHATASALTGNEWRDASNNTISNIWDARIHDTSGYGSQYAQRDCGDTFSPAIYRPLSRTRWLADYVLPAVRGQDVGRITVRFPTAHYPQNERWYGQDIRWLQEIFPIDWILARELDIDVDDTEFVKVDEGPVEYEVEVTDDVGRVLHEDRFAPRFTTREYFPYVPTAKIHYTSGGFRATVNGEEVADVYVRTDPERLWDYYQFDAQPRMFEFAREYTRGDLSLKNQPFFRDFYLDIKMSEPDFLLDLDEERISSMDSLHEDLTFNTIDFWGIFSGQQSGSREVAPGRLMPMIHPTREGPPEVHVKFLGNAVPHPELAVRWTTRDGAVGLGLAFANHLATKYEGSIKINSLPGQGTVTRITLPAGPPAP